MESHFGILLRRFYSRKSIKILFCIGSKLSAYGDMVTRLHGLNYRVGAFWRILTGVLTTGPPYR